MGAQYRKIQQDQHEEGEPEETIGKSVSEARRNLESTFFHLRLLLINLIAPTTAPPLIPSSKLCLEHGIFPRFDMSFLRSICCVNVHVHAVK